MMAEDQLMIVEVLLEENSQTFQEFISGVQNGYVNEITSTEPNHPQMGMVQFSQFGTDSRRLEEKAAGSKVCPVIPKNFGTLLSLQILHRVVVR